MKRLLRPLLPLLLIPALLAGCDSDGTDPPDPVDLDWGYRVEAPQGLGAAAFQVTGMASVSFEDGEAFVRERGGATYLVLVRFEPGELRFRLEGVERGEAPVVTLLEASDEDDVMVESLDGYGVVRDG